MIQMEEKYAKELAPALMKQLGFKSKMQVPTIKKIVVNMCVNQAVGNPKVLDTAADELTAITGQKAVITKAKKSI